MVIQLANYGNAKTEPAYRQNYSGIRLGGGRAGGNRYDDAARNVISQFPSLLSGAWNDSEPTSNEWQAYVSNVVFGAWDDSEPIGTPISTDEPAYTLWDDTEYTT